MNSKKIEELLKRPCFSAAEAKELGVSSALLSYYVKKGTIEKVSRGFYNNPAVESDEYFEWEELLQIAQSIPNGVICVISSLSFYRLTDEFQRQYTIAVPNDSSKIRRNKTKIIRMRSIELGKVSLQIAGYSTFIFDIERSVIDAFRYLSIESAISTLKMYLKGTEGITPNIGKLSRYSKQLKINISPYLEALL